MKNRTALVFGNGSYEQSSFYLKVIKDNPEAYIVAVDGGFDFLNRFNITPNLLIGDLDSIKSRYKGIEVIQVKPEKDETDTRLALNFLYKKGFNNIIMLGMFSLDRLDHSLANIFILVHYVNKGINIQINNYYNRMTFIKGPIKYSINSEINKTISLIPLTPEIIGLSIKGVKYPLNNKNINYSESDLTVSNVITSDNCLITLQEGIILVDLIAHEK